MYKDPILALAKSMQPLPPPGTPHGVALPGTEREGRTAIYRHWRAKDGLVETLDPKIHTIHEMFEASCQKYPNNKMLGWRERDVASNTWSAYKWLDYKTVNKRRADFGAGLRYLHEKVGVSGVFLFILFSFSFSVSFFYFYIDRHDGRG